MYKAVIVQLPTGKSRDIPISVSINVHYSKDCSFETSNIKLHWCQFVLFYVLKSQQWYYMKFAFITSAVKHSALQAGTFKPLLPTPIVSFSKTLHSPFWSSKDPQTISCWKTIVCVLSKTKIKCIFWHH